MQQVELAQDQEVENHTGLKREIQGTNNLWRDTLGFIRRGHK